MITGHPFSRNHMGRFFCDSRGSATIWLTGTVCFVIVFVGVAFLLLKNSNPDRKPPTVPVVSKREVREPIIPYAPSDKVPVEVAGVEKKAGTLPQKEPQEEPDQPARETLKNDTSKLKSALDDDTPDEEIPEQDLSKQAPIVSVEAENPAEIAPLPSSTENHPTVPEKADPIETKLQPENGEKPLSPPPSEPAASVEKMPASSPEPPAPAEPPADENDLKELTVTAAKGNVRRGPSLKDAVLFQISRGDKLQVIDQKGDWYAVRMDDDRSGWAIACFLRRLQQFQKKRHLPLPNVMRKG